MKQIIELLDIMSAKEKKDFLVFLGDRNKRKDVRNIQLFKELIAKEKLKLKHQMSQNAFNVLVKRLTDNLLDFLANEALQKEVSEEIDIIRHLTLSRKLFAHHKIKSAFKLLNQAEKLAVALNHYSILNEIYSTAIQYSHLLEEEEYALLLKKFEENSTELIEQGKLNMAYSNIRRSYLKSELNGHKWNIEQSIQDIYTKFNISKEKGYNFKSIYQLAQISDLLGASALQYHSVNLFFISKLQELENTVHDSEKHLIYHIDLLYLIANIYFRKKEFDNSITFLKKMHSQMIRFENRYFEEKQIQYTTLLALNLNYTGNSSQAINLIDELIDLKQYNSEDLLNPYFAKAVFLFQQNRLNEAKKIISRFTRTDIWYERKMGVEWLLNKNFTEILLHIELENNDYVESRLVAFKKKIKTSNINDLDKRINPFLGLIETYFYQKNNVNSSSFLEKMETTIEWKPKEEEDIFMMSFYAWLKSKLEHKNLYQLTVELIN